MQNLQWQRSPVTFTMITQMQMPHVLFLVRLLTSRYQDMWVSRHVCTTMAISKEECSKQLGFKLPTHNQIQTRTRH